MYQMPVFPIFSKARVLVRWPLKRQNWTKLNLKNEYSHLNWEISGGKTWSTTHVGEKTLESVNKMWNKKQNTRTFGQNRVVFVRSHQRLRRYLQHRVRKGPMKAQGFGDPIPLIYKHRGNECLPQVARLNLWDNFHKDISTAAGTADGKIQKRPYARANY